MKKTTFSSYFGRIITIAVLFFSLPVVLSTLGEMTTTASYIRAVFCFFVLTVLSSSLLLGRKYVKFYGFAFIALVLLGLVHYVLLIDPSYFQSDGGPVETFWGEYLSVFNSIQKIIDEKKIYGIFYFDKNSFEVTHPEIWHIISYPMFFLQHKWLNYSPLNVFSMLVSSMNVMLVFNKFNTGNVADVRYVRKELLYVTAFFPMGLLNGTMWRDPFGMLLISTGLSLLMLSDSLLSRGISFILLTVFSYFQRTVYAIITTATVFVKELMGKRRAVNIVIIPLLLVVLYFMLQFFQESDGEHYVAGYVNNQSFTYLPVKILVGLIGPFPWTQFSQYFMGNLSMAYQPADYLIGTFQLGYLFALIMNWKNFSFKNLDYMTIMGFGIMLSGFMTKHLHIGYIYEGLYFTLPWFFKQIGSRYWKYFGYAFAVLVLLNVVAIGLGGFGISSSWK